MVGINVSDPVQRQFITLPTWDGITYGSYHHDSIAMCWTNTGQAMMRLGVADPTNPSAFFEFDEGVDPISLLIARLREQNPRLAHNGWIIEPLNIPPKRYFPRIARPNHQHPGDLPGEGPSLGQFAHERAAAAAQAISLTDRLMKTFRVVDPDQRNMQSFGGEFREIIILAATEFEAQAKGILRANHYPRIMADERLSTPDFIKIEPALRLADYAMTFDLFPWIEPVAPFDGWNADNPTQSLRWYHAYNLVKHDREEHFHHATMTNAVSATVAVVVLGIAQFGWNFLLRSSPLKEMFSLRSYPAWSVGDTHGNPTGAAGEILPIDYPFE